DARAVVTERAGESHVAATAERAIPTEVRAMELRCEEHARDLAPLVRVAARGDRHTDLRGIDDLALRSEIVRAETEERERVSIVEGVGDARLVIAIVERGVRLEQREERGGVRVATGGERSAASVRERRFDETSGVDDAKEPFAVRAIGGRHDRAIDDA